MANFSYAALSLRQLGKRVSWAEHDSGAESDLPSGQAFVPTHRPRQFDYDEMTYARLIEPKGSPSKEAGVGPWDPHRRRLLMRLQYCDGEIREYTLDYRNSTIECSSSDEPAEEEELSAWRELEIPKLAIPYLGDFFAWSGIPNLSREQMRALEARASRFESRTVLGGGVISLSEDEDHQGHLWTVITKACGDGDQEGTQEDEIVQGARVDYYRLLHVILADFKYQSETCEHFIRAPYSSDEGADPEALRQLAALEGEQCRVKWHIISETLRWVCHLLSCQYFRVDEDWNDRDRRVQVFFHNISDGLLRRVFGVFGAVVDIDKALGLSDWYHHWSMVLVRFADAILLFQIGQEEGEDFEVIPYSAFYLFGRIAHGFEVTRPARIINPLPILPFSGGEEHH